MAYIDREYSRLLNAIKRDGYQYEDPNRKNVFRTEIPSYTIRHLFKDGFPLITTRALNYNNIIAELLWFLKGDTNIKYLIDKGCNIWNKDAYKHYIQMNTSDTEHMSMPVFVTTIKTSPKEALENWFKEYTLGDLGPVYGHQWRSWDKFEYDHGGSINIIIIDQIKRLIDTMKVSPLATDLIVNAWNPSVLQISALPPCHYGFQIIGRPLTMAERFKFTPGADAKDVNIFIENSYTDYLNSINAPKYGFELHWKQRSVDTFLGLPYNIASYATLALILEKITGHVALGIQGDLKKVHLYDNSLLSVDQQLKNDQYKHAECKLIFPEEEIDPDGFDFNLRMGYLRGNLTFDDFINEMKPEWFAIEGYESYPPINVSMLERDA